MKHPPLTSTHLKLVAISTMLLDHIVVTSKISHDTFFGMLLRIPGRLAAPIMCYMIAEGYHHTSNNRKYLLRLLVFALLSHILYNLCMETRFPTTSVMWSLAMGLAALTVVKQEGLQRWIKVVAVILFSAFSYYANWNFVGVLWIVFFGIYRGNFKKQMWSFLVIGLLLYVIPTYTYVDYGANHQQMPHWYQIFIFAAIPLLMMYNGKKGKGPKWLSRFFYWFYPIHLLLIFIMNTFFRRG